jgi:hypothetical protein
MRWALAALVGSPGIVGDAYAASAPDVVSVAKPWFPSPA